MEPSPPPSRLAHIAGAIALLALGGLRVMDDCGRAGARMGRHADEVAGAGARFGGRSADELAGGARLAEGIDPVAGSRWVDDVPHASTSEPNDVLEAVVEGAVELTFEFVDLPIEGADIGDGSSGGGADDEAIGATGERAVALGVACPARIDLGAEPARWHGFVDTGFGAACAPNLVFGRAVPGAPDVITWGDGERSVQDLAADCWNAGSTCIIVACDDDCSAGIAAIPSSMPDMQGGLGHYTAYLTRAVIALQPKPRVVAVVRGDRAPQLQMLVR